MKKLFQFLTILLALVSVQAEELKSPEIYFGQKIGFDKVLVSYSGIIEYFEYLDHYSARIKITDQGASTLGNRIKLIFVSTEDNLAKLNSHLALNKQLASIADSKSLSDRVFSAGLDEARLFLLITANLHSTEIASSQMVMILAHNLATTNDPFWLDILDKVVLMIVPSANPDGNISVTQWYHKYLGTEFEESRVPFLFHHYAGHDNNRDFFMLNLKESKIINSIICQKYFPQVFLDLHEMDSSGPRMFLPPSTDPLHPYLSPLLMRELELAGSFIALRLQEKGKSGIGNRFLFDSYWPAGCSNTALFKNIIGLLIECASTRLASPIYVTPDGLRGRGKGLPDHKKRVNYPDPWLGGWWKFNNIIEYQTIAVQSLLEFCARNKKTILINYLLEASENIQNGKRIPPFAFAIPQDQWDLSEAAAFIDKMIDHGVRVYKLKRPVTLDTRLYPEDTWIIPLDQPYRTFILAMLKPQSYPEIRYDAGTEIISPYDVAASTIPIMMGVQCEEIKTPVHPEVLKRISRATLSVTSQLGKGNAYLLSGRLNQSWMVVNRLLKQGREVFRITHDGHFKQGDFIVPAAAITQGDISTATLGTAVPVVSVKLTSGDSVNRIALNRIGIYQSYYPISDEGWMRWLLDKFEFPFTVLHNSDFRSLSRLKELDIIIFPDLRRSYIVDGSFSRASRYPPEFRGGIGADGVKNLINFVEEGGHVILTESSSELAMQDFKLPLENVISGLNKEVFFCPGSLLKIEINGSSCLSWGMPELASIMFHSGLAFKVLQPKVPWIQQEIVAGFGAEENHLLSGYLKGPEHLNDTKLIISYKYKKGKVIIYGTRVHYRGWTSGAFKLLLNALYSM